MNSAYLYDTRKAAYVITKRIYYLLETRHWSVKTLSDESNIPYETLKKLLTRKIENTSFHNIMKIALAFNCNLNELLVMPENTSLDLDYVDNVGTSLDYCSKPPKTRKIPLLTPYTFLHRNFPDSLCSSEVMDTLSICSEPFPDIAYGIRVFSFCYHPIYQDGDVLLISQSRTPLPGETGIFLHDNRIHIRLFYQNRDSILLKSVNGLGPDIKIYDFSTWRILGYVAGIQRLREGSFT